MYIAVTGSKNNKDVYIYQSFRKKDGKSSSRIYKKLGKYNTLLEQFDGDNEKLMAWAKSEAAKETELYNERTGKVTVEFSQAACILMNEARSFHAGYLFLQQLCTELRLDNICRVIKGRHKFKYDFHAILTDLVYARVLSPSGKLSSYNFCKTLLEPPKYELQDVYRALSVIAEESDFIQSELYKNSNFIHPRNQKILYYDCMNYYFEIEEESGLKHYGKGKENRPNPIVGMGLFMDADGIPLAFDIFPGNQNEQTTLKPLEKKIIKDFNCSEFIFCSDAGLGSANNRAFLEGNIEEIIKINKQRWEIEENFRIMKTEFEARPVYVRRDDRIKAHFMTCYISLLLYRLLEKKIGNSYTTEQIIETLRSMKMTLLNIANGYVPSYTRTEITDSLHKAFGFRTDYEFIKKSTMRSIIKQTKEINLP